MIFLPKLLLLAMKMMSKDLLDKKLIQVMRQLRL